MGKKELIAKVAKEVGDSQSNASMYLDAILGIIKDEVKEGDTVALLGFGTFSSREVPARDYRNPATGEIVPKPATTVAKCKLSKTFLN